MTLKETTSQPNIVAAKIIAMSARKVTVVGRRPLIGNSTDQGIPAGQNDA